MSCKYKKECPSYSGWCEGPKQDFSKCVEFLITAYERVKEELNSSKRLCRVGDKIGYFHAWEFYSEPLGASPMIGGAPAGVFSKMFGIVEFAEGVRRVDPTDICFCDEMSDMLKERNKNEPK